MALPSWPEGVPYLPRRGEWAVDESYIEPLATDMEGGNTRQRTKPGSNVMTITQTIRMTSAQHDTFFTWVRGTLGNGASRFTGQVWTGSAYQTKTLQFVAPHPKATAAPTRLIPIAMRIRIYGL